MLLVFPPMQRHFAVPRIARDLLLLESMFAGLMLIAVQYEMAIVVAMLSPLHASSKDAVTS
jgi:hypothetical protein